MQLTLICKDFISIHPSLLLEKAKSPKTNKWIRSPGVECDERMMINFVVACLLYTRKTVEKLWWRSEPTRVSFYLGDQTSYRWPGRLAERDFCVLDVADPVGSNWLSQLPTALPSLDTQNDILLCAKKISSHLNSLQKKKSIIPKLGDPTRVKQGRGSSRLKDIHRPLAWKVQFCRWYSHNRIRAASARSINLR